MRSGIILIVTVALAATACTGRPTITEDTRDLSGLGEQLEATGNARFEMTMGASLEGSIRWEGILDFSAGRVWMRMDVRETIGDLSEEFQEFADLLAPMEIILDGADRYVSLPPGTVETAGGARWMRMRAEDASGGPGLTGTEWPAMFGAIVEPAEEVGSETVRGVATTRYRATVHLDRFAEGLGLPIEQIAGSLVQPGEETIPVDVWVDAEGLPRRLAWALPGDAAATVELFDFGVAPPVDLPAPDEVTDQAPPASGL